MIAEKNNSPQIKALGTIIKEQYPELFSYGDERINIILNAKTPDVKAMDLRQLHFKKKGQL